MEENEISKQILDAAITVHKTVGGPGLLINFGRETLVAGYKRIVNGYV